VQRRLWAVLSPWWIESCEALQWQKLFQAIRKRRRCCAAAVDLDDLFLGSRVVAPRLVDYACAAVGRAPVVRVVVGCASG